MVMRYHAPLCCQLRSLHHTRNCVAFVCIRSVLRTVCNKWQFVQSRGYSPLLLFAES